MNKKADLNTMRTHYYIQCYFNYIATLKLINQLVYHGSDISVSCFERHSGINDALRPKHLTNRHLHREYTLSKKLNNENQIMELAKCE